MSVWKELQILKSKDTSNMTEEELECLDREIEILESNLSWEVMRGEE